jgi:hypothetical protein
MMTASPAAGRLATVLRNVTFPAARWQLLAAADAYGADVISKTELHDLPEREYRTVGEVIRAVEASRQSAPPDRPPPAALCRGHRDRGRELPAGPGPRRGDA